jgi:hypothetical protein
MNMPPLHSARTSHNSIRQHAQLIEIETITQVDTGKAYRFCIAPMMEWTDGAEKQSVVST